MAKYYKNLKYHDDNIKKTTLSPENRAFLSQLQTELNTQDEQGQSSPRFWTIIGTKKTLGYDLDYADGVCFVNTSNDNVWWTCQDFLDMLKEEHDDIFCNYDIKINIDHEDFMSHGGITLAHMGQEHYTESFYSMSSFFDWLAEQEIYGYQQMGYKEEQKVCEDTMFLTQADAEQHLRLNHYHYPADAHTYAMTAWRSPRVETLLNLLSSVDWNEKEETPTVSPTLDEKPEDELNIQRVLTISTAHIKEWTNTVLSQDFDDVQTDETYVNDKDWYNVLSIYRKGNYGYYLYLDSAYDYVKASHLPQDLKDCIAYAKSKNCNILCFDSDGAIIEDLDTYDEDYTILKEEI